MPEKPFNVDVPALIFAGDKDKVVGDVDFVGKRIVGANLLYQSLNSAHYHTRVADVEKVVRETESFLERISSRR